MTQEWSIQQIAKLAGTTSRTLRHYGDSDAWWRGMSADERSARQQRTAQLATDWQDAAARGIRPDSDEAQALARRHVAWLTGIPGSPAASGDDVKGSVTGLGEMYVADPRFAANYGGTEGAIFVRDALRTFAEDPAPAKLHECHVPDAIR